MNSIQIFYSYTQYFHLILEWIRADSYIWSTNTYTWPQKVKFFKTDFFYPYPDSRTVWYEASRRSREQSFSKGLYVGLDILTRARWVLWISISHNMYIFKKYMQIFDFFLFDHNYYPYIDLYQQAMWHFFISFLRVLMLNS